MDRERKKKRPLLKKKRNYALTQMSRRSKFSVSLFRLIALVERGLRNDLTTPESAIPDNSYPQSTMNIAKTDPGDVSIPGQAESIDDLLFSSAGRALVERGQDEANPRRRECNVPVGRVLLQNPHA